MKTLELEIDMQYYKNRIKSYVRLQKVQFMES